MAASDHDDGAPTGGFKGTRNGEEHVDNCSEGYTEATTFFKRASAPTARFWDSHHLVIISCVADAHIEVSKPDKTYLKKCLGKTNWNINAGPNVMGLDTKWIYLMHTMNPTAYPESLLPDKLPSHRVDHTRYNTEVYSYMNEEVWKALKQKREDHPKGESLQKELEDASEFFKEELEDRGKLHGGTRHCWKNRNKEGMEDTWYEPFSMAIGGDPIPRCPIPDTLKRYAELFQAIT